MFTYQVKNTKLDGDTDAALPGAGFRLYRDEGCENEIALSYDQTKQAYRPIASGGPGQEMFSAVETGVFNIIGLDHGTYYLKETTIPTGYNELSPNPFVVTIRATHAESGATANVTLAQSSTMDNTIENFTGATLPSTGGMGTTLFYILGGVLVVGAGVLLIVRRRMGGQ